MDNTVGSLTQVQKSVLIGSLLGDGYVRIVPGRKDAFMEVNHCVAQKEYVDWKYKMLGNIVSGLPKQYKNNGKRIGYRFNTRQHPGITKLFKTFYRDGKKLIPEIILNPLILAVWYMDDGSKCGHSSYYLNTQQFSFPDQEKLLTLLKTKGLHAGLNRDKKYWRIRFLMPSVPRLKKLVRNIVIPSLQYKLGL